MISPNRGLNNETFPDYTPTTQQQVAAQNVESREKKRSPYTIVSLEQKTVVGKYAHGTTNAIRQFC